MSIQVSVVIVTYNSERTLERCLGSVTAVAGEVECEIIVVDNASVDDTCDVVAQYAPQATLIRNSANTGFGAASNQGLRAGTGAFKLLLNPDAAPWPGAIEALATYLAEHPGCGVAGPLLHDSDGAMQYSAFNFPTPGNQFFESLFLHRLAPGLTPRFGEVIYDVGFYDHSHPAPWVSGATMLLRAEALDTVGLLDERFFMYSEEKDLCYRMHEAGWSVDLVADAHVTHEHDGSVTPEAFARQVTSKMQYFDKHYRGLSRIACKSGLILGFGTRVVAGALVALSGGSRKQNLLVPLQGVPLYLRARRETRRSREVTA